jgi:hypothetical protein
MYFYYLDNHSAYFQFENVVFRLLRKIVTQSLRPLRHMETSNEYCQGRYNAKNCTPQLW